MRNSSYLDLVMYSRTFRDPDLHADLQVTSAASRSVRDLSETAPSTMQNRFCLVLIAEREVVQHSAPACSQAARAQDPHLPCEPAQRRGPSRPEAQDPHSVRAQCTQSAAGQQLWTAAERHRVAHSCRPPYRAAYQSVGPVMTCGLLAYGAA